MPSRRMLSVAQAGLEPAGHQGLSLAALPVCVPRHFPSALDGIWTRDLLRDRQASTPGCSTRACVLISVAQVGLEPTASLVLSQGGLPVAYRAKWPRMDSNHRFPGCGPGVFAARPRGCVSSVEAPGIASGSPACGAGVVRLDHTPMSFKRKPWGSNPQAASLPPPAFQAGSSPVRMASVDRIKFREVESNHRPPGSEPGVTTNSNCPGSLSLRDKRCSHQVRGGGIEPPSSASKADGLPLADPRSHLAERPAGVEPASPAWKAGALAGRPRAHKAEGEGVEPSRLIARPLSGRLPSPVGLPFRKAAVAGIEPAT